MKKQVTDMERKISLKQQTEIASVDQSYKDYMELRLNETMAEAKRHYQSYIDIRNQYNNFIEGRINTMVDQMKKLDGGSAKSQSIKAQKLHSDL